MRAVAGGRPTPRGPRVPRRTAVPRGASERQRVVGYSRLELLGEFAADRRSGGQRVEHVAPGCLEPVGDLSLTYLRRDGRLEPECREPDNGTRTCRGPGISARERRESDPQVVRQVPGPRRGQLFERGPQQRGVRG